jgi:hypothetical protein
MYVESAFFLMVLVEEPLHTRSSNTMTSSFGKFHVEIGVPKVVDHKSIKYFSLSLSHPIVWMHSGKVDIFSLVFLARWRCKPNNVAIKKFMEATEIFWGM